MEEVFKDIVGYEGLYQVSNKGNVYGIKSKKNIKPLKNKNGYLEINIYKNGVRKTFKVHRLVAFNFIPNINNKLDINHINGIKDDNRVENLEWITRSENMKHYYDILGGNFRNIIKMTKNGDYIETYKSLSQASIKNNIHRQNIQKVCYGKLKTAGGYKWKYEEDTIDLSQV